MQIQTDKDKKELKAHGSYAFPFQISREVLSNYERNAFLWHWHPEIELTYFLQGEMEYQINDTLYHVRAGEALFCNSNTLHAGYMINNCNCSYLAITFHPRLLSGFSGSVMETRYVNAIVNHEGCSSLHISGEQPWEQQAIGQIKELCRLGQTGDPSAYAIEIQILLLKLWQQFYEHLTEKSRKPSPVIQKNTERLKTILSYISLHYQEPLTLDEIAGEINICKSECCRFFKKHMHQSIFEYLLSYRIEKSLWLLTETECSITEAASRVGFSNPCYFGKVFKEQMGCSPSQYRKSQLPCRKQRGIKFETPQGAGY